MECKTARLLAELRGVRDDELPPEDNTALDQHLASCPDCQRALANEQRFDAHVARAMKAVPVPPGLKARILDRLATERGAWYRRRFYQVAAAAAAVVIAVGLMTWDRNLRVKPDLNVVLSDADLLVQNPQDRVDAWLAAQGVRYNPEEPFDPRLLAFHGWAEVQGKKVPVLYYRSFERNVFAQVFILRDGDFDLSALPETFSGSSVYGHQVTVVRDREQPTKVAYVVLFTGDTLEPFRLKYSST